MNLHQSSLDTFWDSFFFNFSLGDGSTFVIEDPWFFCASPHVVSKRAWSVLEIATCSLWLSACFLCLSSTRNLKRKKPLLPRWAEVRFFEGRLGTLSLRGCCSTSNVAIDIAFHFESPCIDYTFDEHFHAHTIGLFILSALNYLRALEPQRTNRFLIVLRPIDLG